MSELRDKGIYKAIYYIKNFDHSFTLAVYKNT